MKSASNPALHKRGTVLVSLCLSGLFFVLGWFALHSQQQAWQAQLEQQQRLTQQQPLGNLQSPQPAAKASANTKLERDLHSLVSQHQQQSRALYLQWSLAWLIASAALLGLLLMHQRRTQQLIEQQPQLRQQQALRALNEIAAISNISRMEQIRQALRLGVNFYNMPISIVSRVDGQDFKILVQISVNDALADGQHFELSHTYCQLPIDQQQVVAIEHMGKSAYADLGCYQLQRLESYIGSPVWVNGQLFGVLNFAAAEPRTVLFDEIERDFIRLLARWIGAILERHEQEQSQQALLTRLQHITSQVPGAIYEYLVTPDGHQCFPYASEGLRAIYGVNPEDIREDSSQLMDIAHPDDRDRIEQSIVRSMEELSMWQIDFRVIHPSKGLLWVEGRSVPQRLADGSTRWFGFIADITARKQTEEQLQQARGFLQAVVNSSTEVAMIATDPSGEITLFNSGAERLLGYSASEIIGQHPVRFHLLEEIEQRSKELSEKLQREVRGFEVFTVLPQSGQTETRHWTYVRKDQQRRLVDLTITSIRSEQGELQGYLGIATDITEFEQTNRALQKSERRFRSMVSSLPGVVYRCANDSDWSMLYLSDDIERLTGYPASDFIGNRVRSFASIQHPDDQPQIQATLVPIARQEHFAVSYRIRHAEGHWIWVSEKGRGDYDENGQLLWLNGFIWDITEQRKAEQERQTSERKLSALYQLAPVGITLTRVDSGRVIDSNPEFQRMQGMTSQQVLDTNFRDRTPVEFLPEQARQMDLLLKNGTYGPFEKELVHLDGKRIQVLMHGALLEDQDGSQLIWSILQDISQRVISEKAAHEREHYIRTLFDSVIDAIIISDTEGLIEDYNPAAELMFGYSSQTMLGRSLDSLASDPKKLALYRTSERIPNATQRLELQGLRCNGEVFQLELAVSQTLHQGQHKLIAVMRDITERNRIDQLKSEFVSGVSHELRTPLTAIAGSLGLILGGALGEVSPTLQPMLKIAHQSSQRLSLLINDLLDMDKLLAGKMNFELRPQALQPVLEEALRSNQSYADQFHVRLRQLEPTEQWVHIDDLRLQQVLANYLANAAKFSPTGGEVLLQVEHNAETVRVSVQDQGPGIPAAFRKRIFQKFSQADGSNTRKIGGTGLGLAISKELIERMGGTLGFDSIEGQGSTFWLELPLCEANSASAP